MRGFTLFEMLLVIAVITVLSTIAFGYYYNFGKNVELDTVSYTLKSDLRRARSSAMASEDGLKWGVHLVNAGSDYYEVFKTTTTYANGTVMQTVYLPKAVVFLEPQEGMAHDALFNKINGTTSATTIILASSGRSTTITITTGGTVY